MTHVPSVPAGAPAGALTRLWRSAAATFLLSALAAAGLGRAEAADAGQIARGEYLARLGDCVACHTA